MSASLATTPGLADLGELLLRFLLLSLLSVGGAITTAPEMHRYLVEQRGWIDDASFNASIALAHAAPGPNILFVTLIGWNVAGPAGAFAATVGILLPSSLLAVAAERWMRRHQARQGVQAFRIGMAPIVLGLLMAIGWILATPGVERPALLALTVVTVLVVWRTRINPLWLIAAGAITGMLIG